MPVDRQHAFAGGGVYGPPSPFARLLRTEVARVWASFEHGAVLGNGCRFGASAWCANEGPREQIRLGNGVVCRGILRRESFGDGLIEVGDDVYIGDDCIVSCAEHVVIGSGTLLGHGVQIFDNNSHPTDASERSHDWTAIREGAARGTIRSEPVIIGPRAWIGFGAFILKGASIGAEAIVGAGAIVTGDVPAGGVVGGSPSRPILPREA